MLGSTWNAKRFAGKPMRQPAYNFENIPKPQRSLESSTVERVENREHFIDAMGELVLLCNQAMKRAGASSPSKKSSKPLSLEYIADRLDVDDPIWGYVVRDKSTQAMQGFITCTTFTNWQKSFRWDSMHDSAFAYDPPQLARQVISGERVVDSDGSLAAALQSCVKCGDMWNEGIVSPRIAEISLLGALGCGKALLSLVLEQLERLPPSATQNYDYVVLQATENSVSFYESMGFVRVGCVTEDDKFEEKQRKAQCSDTETDESSLHAADPMDSSSSEAGGNSKPATDNEKSEIVSSPVIEYTVVNPGETPTEIARSSNVDVWDIVFLNHFVYKDINPRSRLMKDTKLYLPSSESAAMARTRVESSADLENMLFPGWYVAAENDTPKMIAKKFGLNCADVVAANRGRLPDLQGVSRLKEGTRIKVSHFDVHDDKFVPYCHWSFPDDTFEHADPSYMMARKLNRSSNEKKSSLEVIKYQTPPASLYAAPEEELEVKDAPKTPPPKPKRPANPYMLYTGKVRQSVTASMKGAATSKVIRQIASMWKELPEKEKQKYTEQHEAAKSQYKVLKEDYDKQMEAHFRANPRLRDQGDTSNLFNKVIRLRDHEATKPHADYDYYYVLTFIPDLQWAHLAPMRRVGYWEASGRPVWMLVDEKLGKEVDISSSFCIPVASKAVKRTVDADRERWDIYESGPGLKPAPEAGEANDRAVAPSATRSATKPLGGVLVKRKYAELDPFIFSPNVLKRPQAVSPGQRGTNRELLSRRAAPVSFSDASRTPKHPNRGTLQTLSPELPRGRKRVLPPKTKCPIESASVLSSLGLKQGILLFDENGEVIQMKRGRGRPRKHPLLLDQQVEPVKRGRPPKTGVASSKKRGRPPKNEVDSEELPKKTGRGRPPKNGTVAPKKRGRTRKNDGDSLEPPKKRGRGRPPKNSSSSANVEVKNVEPAKRGRGRPPKDVSRSPGKRVPGRPPKIGSPKRGPGHPPKSGCSIPKRGPASPPKNGSSTTKRGPGRPPKATSHTGQQIIAGRVDGSMGSSPSRDGRARKTPDFFKPGSPAGVGVRVFSQRAAHPAGVPTLPREDVEDATPQASKSALKASSRELVTFTSRPSRGGWTGSPRLRQLPNRKAESVVDESAIAARRAHAKSDPSSPLLVGRRITRGR